MRLAEQYTLRETSTQNAATLSCLPATHNGLLAQELPLIDEYGSFVYNTGGL